MRAGIEFTSDSPIILPISYNHLIQAFIYQNIANYEIRQELHDTGYQVGKRRLKFFTFSKLNGRFELDKNLKQIKFYPPVMLKLSFYSDSKYDILSDIISNILKNNNLYIGENKVIVKTIAPENYNFYKNEYLIKMISPILLYRTEKKDSKYIRKYISPWDHEFEDLILQNIKTKVNAAGKEYNISDFTIIPMNPPNPGDGKIIGYKQFKVKAYFGTFRIKGDKQLLKLLYETGIGSGNSEGFGCFDVIG